MHGFIAVSHALLLTGLLDLVLEFMITTDHNLHPVSCFLLLLLRMGLSLASIHWMIWLNLTFMMGWLLNFCYTGRQILWTNQCLEMSPPKAHGRFPSTKRGFAPSSVHFSLQLAIPRMLQSMISVGSWARILKVCHKFDQPHCKNES